VFKFGKQMEIFGFGTFSGDSDVWRLAALTSHGGADEAFREGLIGGPLVAAEGLQFSVFSSRPRQLFSKANFQHGSAGAICRAVPQQVPIDGGVVGAFIELFAVEPAFFLALARHATDPVFLKRNPSCRIMRKKPNGL
jgi:hypothetical protein